MITTLLILGIFAAIILAAALDPNHPNLLATFSDAPVFDMDKPGQVFYRKPILAREGANIAILEDGRVKESTDGPYEKSEVIYQEGFSLPNYGGRYPVIGSWCVDGLAAGMGIREDGLITSNTASFIPHIIEG